MRGKMGLLTGQNCSSSPLGRERINDPFFAFLIAAICPAHPAGPPFLPKNPPRPICSTVALFRTANRNPFVQRLRSVIASFLSSLERPSIFLDEASIMLRIV